MFKEISLYFIIINKAFKGVDFFTKAFSERKTHDQFSARLMQKS